MTEAKAVVEIGTGTGVSGLWLLRGMRPDGVLTTVDTEAEHQRLAKKTFAEAGIPSQRARLINGAALDVLPRLTDGHYDLVFCDGDKREYSDYLTEALRLLKPGGVVAFDNALWHDRVADPAQRDAETVAIRELGKTVRESEELLPLLRADGRRPAGRPQALSRLTPSRSAGRPSSAACPRGCPRRPRRRPRWCAGTASLSTSQVTSTGSMPARRQTSSIPRERCRGVAPAAGGGAHGVPDVAAPA